jgi:DNA ligase D-like protein (predicted ligase)
MECLSVAKVPQGEEWQYELKLDGYRTIAVKDGGEVSLFSRNGNSFNAKFPSIVDAVAKLRPKRFVIDGEIVALDENGRHSFQLLQRIKSSKAPLRFYLFDLLKTDAENLMGQQLKNRRARLEDEFKGSTGEVQLSPILEGDVDSVVDQVQQFEFEGVIAKRVDSIYVPGESPGTWQKHKTQQTDDFLIGGYVPGNRGVDELVVGERRGQDLHFVASIKNGFVPATRARAFQQVEECESPNCPFANLPEKKGPHRMDKEKMRKVRWLKPRLICEVAFNERTGQGHLRHSKFLRIRDAEDLRTKNTSAIAQTSQPSS